MQTSKTTVWLSRVMVGLSSLFFIMDGVMKLFKPSFVVSATTELGYPEATIIGIGVTLLVCTALYLVPRTSILGAVLITGYLGGAIASKVRVEAPVFDFVFAIAIGAMVWGGLWLRDTRLRELFPWQNGDGPAI
jgi:DoxX-like family